MADQRLNAVYEAASFLFIKNGFENTQVSQIAKLSNIATGTVYNLFSGKKSLLHFVLIVTFDKKYLDSDVVTPIQDMDESILINYLNQTLEGLNNKLRIKSKEGKPGLPFIEFLSNVFDYAADYQVAFNIINDNQKALSRLEGIYRKFITDLYSLLNYNLTYYISIKEVREIELPELHIRNIMEGITWWAMYLPYQSDKSITVEKAKEIALDTLKHAYLVDPI